MSLHVSAVTGRLPSALTCCLGLAVLMGCGDGGKATVTGKIIYKGAPVTGGAITLYPASGAPYPVDISPNGFFSVSDVPVGSMEVAISTDSVPTTTGYQLPPGVTPPKDTPMSEPPRIDSASLTTKVKIPDKYRDPKTSGLTWDIKGGKNTRNFDLTD